MRTLLNVHHPRAFVATALANAIYAAHETNELSWSVNVHNEQIKLTLVNLQCFTCDRVHSGSCLPHPSFTA
jgi:hypothetical protein